MLPRFCALWLLAALSFLAQRPALAVTVTVTDAEQINLELGEICWNALAGDLPSDSVELRIRKAMVSAAAAPLDPASLWELAGQIGAVLHYRRLDGPTGSLHSMLIGNLLELAAKSPEFPESLYPVLQAIRRTDQPVQDREWGKVTPVMVEGIANWLLRPSNLLRIRTHEFLQKTASAEVAAYYFKNGTLKGYPFTSEDVRSAYYRRVDARNFPIGQSRGRSLEIGSIFDPVYLTNETYALELRDLVTGRAKVLNPPTGLTFQERLNLKVPLSLTELAVMAELARYVEAHRERALANPRIIQLFDYARAMWDLPWPILRDPNGNWVTKRGSEIARELGLPADYRVLVESPILGWAKGAIGD
jgi:hypothetical protein